MIIESISLIILFLLSVSSDSPEIIRSAFAFNFDAVCLLKNNSPIETPSLIKASAGEIDKIQILEIGNLVQEIKILKKHNFFIYGLDGEGKTKIQEIDKTDDTLSKKTVWTADHITNGTANLKNDIFDSFKKVFNVFLYKARRDTLVGSFFAWIFSLVPHPRSMMWFHAFPLGNERTWC